MVNTALMDNFNFIREQITAKEAISLTKEARKNLKKEIKIELNYMEEERFHKNLKTIYELIKRRAAEGKSWLSVENLGSKYFMEETEKYIKKNGFSTKIIDSTLTIWWNIKETKENENV